LSVIIFSDASSVACGAYAVELDKKVIHQMWDNTEACKSSTWREMKAIEQALKALQNCLKGKTVKWLTDDQNCIYNLFIIFHNHKVITKQ
jgi:tRNA(Arg) A34 adenosine deaminase TadA